jgi:hypothetical protein
MKCLLGSLSVTACTITAAFGFLSETEAELQARYGEPKEITRSDGDPLKGHKFTSEHDGYRIRVSVFDGKSQSETYRHLGGERPFTAAEIHRLLAGNSGGKGWTQDPDRRWLLGDKSAPDAFAYLPTEGKDVWEVYTAASAAYSRLGTLMPPPSFSGKEEVLSGIATFRQVDSSRLLTFHIGRTVIEIPLPEPPLPALGDLKAGETYRIILLDREAGILELAAFVTDREHKTWHDIVYDSIAKPLLRIEQGQEVVFDRSICEVHHVKMELKDVDISYGMPGAATEADAYCDLHFPHHRNFAEGGCVVSDTSPKSGLIYICPQCVADCGKYKGRGSQ